MSAPAWSKRHGLAAWLARHLRCSVAEADERLQASRRAAFRLTASDAEWRADDDYRDATAPRTGVRVDVADEVAPTEGISAQLAWELMAGPGLAFGEVVRRG
mgnify:CR=1 FL=1